MQGGGWGGVGAAGAPGRCPSPETHPAWTLRSWAPQDTRGAHNGSKDRAKGRDGVLAGLMSRGQSHPLSRGEPGAQGRPEETHSCNCCFHKQPRTIKSTDVVAALGANSPRGSRAAKTGRAPGRALRGKMHFG